MMWKKSSWLAVFIRWHSIIAALLLIVPSSPLNDSAVDAFTSSSSRTHRNCRSFSLKLPSVERFVADLGNLGRADEKYSRLFSSNSYDRNNIGIDIGSLPDHPDELRHRIAQQKVLHPDFFVRPTDEWFRHYLHLSKSEERKIYSRLPNGIKSIQRLGRHRLHAWFTFFLSDATVGLDHHQLRKMIVSRPQLLSYKLSNVQITTNYFREELGLSSEELASLLQSYPSVLMYSVDTRLRPTVDFLQNECGGGKNNWASWKRVIYSYPNIFSHSPEKTLLPKLHFLCNGGDDAKSLGLNRSELSQVVAKFPPTLWLSEQNLQSKLDFLSESLNLNEPELRSIIVSYPQVLGLSLDGNLRLKVDFFLGDKFQKKTNSINCGLSKDQLKEFVIYQPALLAYSLENRIKPRISRMQEKNIFFYYCPKNLMSYTDKKFDDWMSTQVATWSISE
mmetsp:Transcript_24537/g.53084  ORF Transcript_24537/g.53084 Transcript_24537/m.53084 type:complete len:447 (+) Transcript_24537:53-1393(+)